MVLALCGGSFFLAIVVTVYVKSGKNERDTFDIVKYLVIFGAVVISAVYKLLQLKKESQTKSQSEDILICTSCGWEVPQGASKCPECGAHLKETDTICPQCKEEISEQDMKCAHCGCIFSTEEEENNKQSDEEFECSECGGIISDQDKKCPHCNAALMEEENETDTAKEKKLSITSAIPVHEKFNENKDSSTSTENKISNSIELRLIERSELKNIIREMLTSDGSDYPAELRKVKQSFENIFTQLEHGTLLQLSAQEISILEKMFAHIVSQSKMNSTLETLHKKFTAIISINTMKGPSHG
jgi:uncharacterized protein YheU (UPF0270 family)